MNMGNQYISRTLDALNIEPGNSCLKFTARQDQKAAADKSRKSSVEFKGRREEDSARKEAKEVKTYETSIGLNLTLTSEPHIHDVDYKCLLNSITEKQLENYESVVSDHTTRPSVVHDKYDTEKLYNFIVFDTETNTTGKNAELCQLAANMEWINFHATFSQIKILTFKQASRVNKLTIKSVNGNRKLFKENRPVETVSLHETITQFTKYLERTINKASISSTDNKPVCTVLVGHNAATFDTPILLRNGSECFAKDLKRMGIRLADTLPLFKKLVKNKHPALKLAKQDGTSCRSNQQPLYECLFQEHFDAHDALQDVLALRKILFCPTLVISEEDILNNCFVVDVMHAAEDFSFLDHRHELMQSFRGKLYNPGRDDRHVKQNIAEKIAGSGLSYKDPKTLYAKFGAAGLV